MEYKAFKRKNKNNAVTDSNFERKHMIASNMNFAASEAYKLLRTNILFSFSGKEGCRVIGMTSSFRGEGKSLTSINLAYTLAVSGKSVLLIEGDMRLPTMAKRLGISASPGLSNILVGVSADSIPSFGVSSEEGVNASVDVLVSGDVPPNPSELLGSEHMQALIKTLRKHYEYIILDLPPVTAVTDALVACKLVDGMVVVVRNNHAVRRALTETIRQLRLVDAHILGFVFNGASGSGSGYYRGKKYYRSSDYEYKKQ
ncbi:MAG: CpsD/CapB family tyrosine-protein kinase [Oscillospiraceae bacterium]|nr:CpsD/CapB family tyrosine-protein kinase [Oscillospiraceae bacterium]